MAINDLDNLRTIGSGLAHHVTDILKTTKTLNIDWTDEDHMYMAEYIDLKGLGVQFSSIYCDIRNDYAHITFRFLVCDDNVLKQRLTNLGLDVGEVRFQAVGRVVNECRSARYDDDHYEGVLRNLRAWDDENIDLTDEAIVWDTRQELNTSAFANYYALTSTFPCDDKVLETTAKHINTWSTQDTHFMLLAR